MRGKPILLWPNARSDIAAVLHREPDGFVVVDTNSPYELQRLYPLKNNTPIFDPFPGRGDRYSEFKEHIGTNPGRHIAGLDLCRQVLQALNEPSLARASIEEICNALAAPGRAADQPKWSIGSPNTGLLTVLVFPVTLVGNWLFPQDILLASLAATACFAGTYLFARLITHSWLGGAAWTVFECSRSSLPMSTRACEYHGAPAPPLRQYLRPASQLSEPKSKERARGRLPAMSAFLSLLGDKPTSGK